MAMVAMAIVMDQMIVRMIDPAWDTGGILMVDIIAFVQKRVACVILPVKAQFQNQLICKAPTRKEGGHAI